MPSDFLRILKNPAAAAVLLGVLLVAIGEWYPFSHFPMYAKIDGRAEVLYITNEKDEPLPTSKLFGTGSAQLKKRYETRLEKVAGTKDYDRASKEQLDEAGRAFLTDLVGVLRTRPHRVKEFQPKALRVWIVSLDAERGAMAEKRFTAGEVPVPAIP